MKKIRFLILALVGLLGGVVSASGKTVYIKPNEWAKDNAIISLNVWVNGTGGNIWTTLTEVEDGILKATFDDSFNKMAIMRGPEANKWNNEGAWNQTADMDIEDGKLYKLYDYDGQMSGIYDGHGVVVEDYTEPAAAGYKVDFNTALATGAADFKVASNWKHIVDIDTDYDNYMKYQYKAEDGIDGTGALLALRQLSYNNMEEYDGNESYDMLVTPIVSGDVTIYAKKFSSNPFVEFWSLNADGTAKNTKLKGVTSFADGEWVAVTYNVATPQRIGIRAQYVYLDNFSAESAEIEVEKSMSVNKVMNDANQEKEIGTNPVFEQQADGKLLVKLNVELSNTGDEDLVAGSTENYTLTLARSDSGSGSKTYYEDASIAVPENLAKGETKTMTVQFTVPYVSGYSYWFVKENISGSTSSSYRYASAVAYESKFVIREAGSTSTSSLSATQNWGTVNVGETVSKSYEICNLGTAPMTLYVEGSVFPEDVFSLQGGKQALLAAMNAMEDVHVDLVTKAVTFDGGAVVPFTIVLNTENAGSFTGDVSVAYNEYGAEQTTFTLGFSATVIGESTWAADFNNSSNTVVYPEGSVAEGGITSDYQYISSGNYNNWLIGRNIASYATENNKFITPKLHANAGDQLAFDVKAGYSSSDDYFVKVYVSTDRKNWGEPVASYTYSNTGSSFVTKSVSFDAEGDYYIAFALYGTGSGIDNLSGLKKIDVAHDLYIKSVSWPHEAGKYIKNGSAQTKPSVEFIPLTNETADSYTVKYVCGETVLGEGTPVALTASANSSKTIAINWTPSVESTTTFEGTKVVFEFTGGTKVETETFDLTVTNEPIFHFLNTKYTSRWYEPSSDYTTPYSFGKTNEAGASKTFWILNWGSAPLTVKSIVVPEGFTASVSSMTLPAFDGTQDGLETCQQSFDITFSATEAGTYSGDMVITYVNGEGEDATFTLAVSGTMLDPNGWYANFDDGGWPAGSVYQSNVRSNNGGTYSVPNYYITSSSATNNLFITPKLTATAGDKLAFDAKLYSGWNEGKVVVYAAATRDELVNFDPEADTRTAIFTASGAEGSENLLTTDYQTFEIPAVAGDNYYAFEISGRPYVDELYGLKLADVAHDWMLVSSNIPTEAMQNVASTATVNILNLGIQDEAAEDITVTAYVDGEAVATGEGVAIPMSHQLSEAGTQLSINFIYQQVGTFPVYLEVKAGDYSVKTEAVDVTFAEEEAKSEIGMESNGASATSLLHLNWNNSESVNLYSAATLESLGLKSGDKISSITFRGYNSGSKNYSTTLNVWYEFTDDATQAAPSSGKYDTSSMTNVVNTERSWANAEGSSSNLVDIITINFAEPITFTGKSLRIVVCSEGTQFQSGTNFELSKISGSGTSYYNRNDTYNTFANTQSWSANTYLPAIHFGLAAQSATLTGNVRTSAGAGIANATVTLKAENGVEYSATSDAEGNYSMNVVQGGLDFTATVEAEGFLKREFAENLGGESKTLDVVMYKKYGILGNIPGFDWDNDVVMTQDEENPMVFTLVKDVVVETAGNYNYKMRADGAWAGNEEGQLAHGYELPASGNNTVNFPSAGTYVVTFTADVDQHSLDAEVALKTFTLAENACEEGQPNIFEITSEIANLTVVRTFNAGWNAVVLPFALTQEEVTTTFGEGSKVAYFNGDTKDANGNVTVKFDELTGDLDANVPYMIYVATATTNPTFNNKTFVDPHGADLKAEVLGTAFDFMGTYVNLDVNAGDMFVSGGKFKTATTNNKVRAFRAYLKSKTEGARQVNIFVDGEEISIATPTAIDGIDVDNVDGNVYNINGQRVNKNVKHGVYIINGKKVVRK